MTAPVWADTDDDERTQENAASGTEDNSTDTLPSLEIPPLSTIVVDASPLDAQVQAIPEEYMRRSARSDLAEVLEIVLSVRVSEGASSNLQQGDLKPAEFSIRSAAPYQNRFELDGASVDNLIDPAQKESVDNYTRLAGHSQGLFINTDFLQFVDVADTNISARKGGFTGGVVEARTKAYAGRDEARLSYRATSDSLTNFHVDKSQQAEFEDSAAQAPTGVPGEFQPDL